MSEWIATNYKALVWFIGMLIAMGGVLAQFEHHGSQLSDHETRIRQLEPVPIILSEMRAIQSETRADVKRLLERGSQ